MVGLTLSEYFANEPTLSLKQRRVKVCWVLNNAKLYPSNKTVAHRTGLTVNQVEYVFRTFPEVREMRRKTTMNPVCKRFRVVCPDCGTGGANEYPCFCHVCDDRVLMLPATQNWNEVSRLYKGRVSTFSPSLESCNEQRRLRMPLWSDDKTNEDIQKLAETNSDSVVYNLHEDLLCVKEDLAKADERVKELEKERETGYEVWQAKYQALKDSMSLTTCYECGTRVYELSPRSRCCMCEYGRAQFNERENEQLRKEQE